MQTAVNAYRIKGDGEPGGKAPEQFAQFIRSEQILYLQVVKAANIKVD
ncbi:hypothetical protein [Variovorax sp. HW608]|nr:hypothetical protein [Variovorax sp. HW608]